MEVPLTPELETAIGVAAKLRGVTPEALALDLIKRNLPSAFPPLEPRDDWERRLFAIGTDCGVSLSNEALSSEGLYD